MNALFQLTLIIEFMFFGYCQYIYFSAFFRNKQNSNLTLMLFLLASCVEYVLYVNFYHPLLNALSIITFSTAISIFCYESHFITSILHSCITTCMLTLCELYAVLLTSPFLDKNYLENRTQINELMMSTISKLLMFIVCRVIKQIAEKESQKTRSAWLFIVPVLSMILIFQIYDLSSAYMGVEKYNFVLFVSFVVLMVINVVVFKVHEDNIRSANENAKLKLSEQKQMLDYENYKLLQKNYENSRILIHDIKHHLNIINSMAENEDLKKYLKSLQLQEYLNDPQKLTGNKIIDVIIHQKSEICRTEK